MHRFDSKRWQSVAFLSVDCSFFCSQQTMQEYSVCVRERECVTGGCQILNRHTAFSVNSAEISPIKSGGRGLCVFLGPDLLAVAHARERERLGLGSVAICSFERSIFRWEVGMAPLCLMGECESAICDILHVRIHNVAYVGHVMMFFPHAFYLSIADMFKVNWCETYEKRMC